MRKFELMRGPQRDAKGDRRLHPAIQLQQVWSLADEDGAAVDFVELCGHWCPQPNGQGEFAPRCAHVNLAGRTDPAARTISVALGAIGVIEEIEEATFYWVDQRPHPFCVLKRDAAVDGPPPDSVL